jgi:hypothetical protein
MGLDEHGRSVAGKTEGFLEDVAVKHFVSSEAVETFQVIYDTIPEATGTAERLLGGLEARFASPFG